MRYVLLATMFLTSSITACGTANDKLKDTQQPQPSTDKPTDETPVAKTQDKATESKATASVAVAESTDSARNAVSLYVQETEQYIGNVIDSEGTIRMDDGSVVRFNAYGEYQSSVIVAGKHFMPAACAFASANCTGDCYAVSIDELYDAGVEHPKTTSNNIDMTLKNSLYYTPAGWLRARGSEPKRTDLTFHSFVNVGGLCKQAVWHAGAAFLLTTPYTLSQSPELPFNGFGSMYYK